MSEYMTAGEARELIRDAMAGGVYAPIHGSYFEPLKRGRIAGCAMCALYLGAGGCQAIVPADYDYKYLEGANRDEQVEFLIGGYAAKPVRENDLDALEAGFENYDHLATNPFYQVGVELREGRLGMSPISDLELARRSVNRAYVVGFTARRRGR